MEINYYFEESDIAPDEGVWVIILEEPIDTSLSYPSQINLFYNKGYLNACNQTMATMYGFDNPEQMIGARLEDMLPANPANLEYLLAFIKSNYDLQDAESKELDKNGKTIYFLNSLEGIFKDGKLIAAKGRQKILKK